MKSTQYNKLFVITYSFFIALIFFLALKSASHVPILFSLILSAFLILILSIALCYYKLTISINDDYVAFSFGIGLIKKKYRLEKIKKCTPVLGKFSAYSRISFKKLPNGGKSYVLSSALPSVEITYENENGIIISDRVGTDNPNEIADYINRKISNVDSSLS